MSQIQGLGFKIVYFGHWIHIMAFIQYFMHYFKETKPPWSVYIIFFKKSCAVYIKMAYLATLILLPGAHLVLNNSDAI